MAEKHIYRVFCETDGKYVETGWLDSEPTECPEDAGHDIDTNSITVIKTLDAQPYGFLNFSDGTNPYIEITSTDYVTIGCFCFDPAMRDLLMMNAVVDKTGTADDAVIRIRNTGEGNNVFRKAFNAEGKQGIVDDTVGNQPTQQGCLDIQVKVKDAADSIKVYSVSML